MPAPNLNRGRAPHDTDNIQDLWYALEQLGFSTGFLKQTDYDFVKDSTLSANGEITTSVRAPGGGKLNGQVTSTGQFTLNVRWLDADDSVVREEGISANHEANDWANFSLDPKSPFADIVVYDDTGSDQTVNITTHYR